MDVREQKIHDASASAVDSYNDDFTRQSVDDLCGAEQFLVGISPQYWANTPMTIQTLCSLGLVEGIDCFVIKSNDSRVRFVPVSKCDLHGVIVNVDRKSNGSSLYLLDDGTGFVDCMVWSKNGYCLPPLVGHDEASHAERRLIKVGDVVRVLGKIRCVSIGNIRETISMRGRTWEVRDCIREVHVSSITAVSLLEESLACSLNTESNHWLRCCQLGQRLLFGNGDASLSPGTLPLGTSSEVDDVYFQSILQQSNQPVRNGRDVLLLLGPEITKEALERRDFPSAGDATGAWRLFGVSCRCQLPYMEALLYCHCQATMEDLDPHFVFRDALLWFLLQLETNLPQKSDGSCSLSHETHLIFQYKSVLQVAELQKIATKVASGPELNCGADSSISTRLFVKTFSALRKDGIVFLLDSESDTYLLISRQRVLEPHVRAILHRSTTGSMERNMPDWMASVPNARMQYIRKRLVAEQRATYVNAEINKT